MERQICVQLSPSNHSVQSFVKRPNSFINPNYKGRILMEIIQNLHKTFYVKNTVKDWIKTARILSDWKNNSYRQVDLVFKTGEQFDNVYLGSAWSLINYYYWSQRLGGYNIDDLTKLNEIGNYIYSQLRDQCGDNLQNNWGMQGTHGILYYVVRKYRPELFIETGVAHGYSSMVILSAMEKNNKGSLISVELSQYFNICQNQKKVGWIVAEGLRNRWEIKYGKSSEVLPTIKEEIDIFYHDSDHSESNMLFEFRWAAEQIRKDGIIISDDIDRNKSWKIFHKENSNLVPLIRTVTTGVSFLKK